MTTTRLARTDDDRRAAVEVWRAARAAQGRRPNAEVVDRVAQKAATGLLVLAEEDDRVVGLALGEPGHDDETLLHLEMVVVHPDAQGHGLGTVLVEAIADEGWGRGFRHADVWCTAPGFYEACGFERTGEEKDDGGVHLRAELESPVRDVEVRGDIRLGQFLKLAELVDTGAEAKTRIAEGEVSVEDEVETRRGRQLADGEVVRTASGAARVRIVPAQPAQ